MPNWCDTTYKCVSDDKKELKALKKIIDANNRRKTSRVNNGFGTLWIGNIIDHLGYDWKQYRCRGEITDYYLDEEGLTICQSTAWCEQEGFREVIEKAFPSIKVYYKEEEPGCEVYYTNDSEGTYFPERYLLDGTDTYEYFESIDDAVEYVASIVGSKPEASVNGINSALDNYTEALDDDDVWYVFHEFKVV